MGAFSFCRYSSAGYRCMDRLTHCGSETHSSQKVRTCNILRTLPCISDNVRTLLRLPRSIRKNVRLKSQVFYLLRRRRIHLFGTPSTCYYSCCGSSNNKTGNRIFHFCFRSCFVKEFPLYFIRTQ